MASNDLLKKIHLARSVQWQYKLEDYTVESLNTITKALSKARNELLNQVMARDIILPPDREDKVLKKLNDMTLGIQHKLTGNITEAAEIAGQASFREYDNILSFDGRLAETVGFNFSSISAEQMKAMVAEPFAGKMIKDWVKDDFRKQLTDEIKSDLLAGVFKGDSTKKLVDRLRDSFDVLERDAITLTRTFISDVNNRAAESVYKANSDIIKEVEWNATLEVSTKTGRGTCMRCAARDSKTWPIDSDYIRPPLHFSCRCFLLAVTLSFRELGLNINEIKKAARPYTKVNGIPVNEGGKRKILDFGMFEGNAQDFIKAQGPLYMKNVVGPGRMALMDAGLVDFDDLVTRNGRVKLLKELPKLGAGKIAKTTALNNGWVVSSGVSKEFNVLCKKNYNELPKKARELIEASDYKFMVGGRVTEVLPSLKGVHPRGWPAGSTWDSAEALFNPSGKMIVVCENYRPMGKKVFVKTKRVEEIVKHESGHAVDALLSQFSNSPEFIAKYTIDVKNISAIKKYDYKYFLQKGSAGRSECFAQTFAELSGDKSVDMKSIFPNVYELIRTNSKLSIRKRITL